MKTMKERKGGLTAYLQDAWGPGKSLQSIRTIACWICTFVISFEMTAGALWGLLRIEYVRVVFAHLGYPIYLVSLASGKFRLRLYCFSQACSDSRSGRTPGPCSTTLARQPPIFSPDKPAWVPSRRRESSVPLSSQ
jgi:hypothetical protein